MEIDDKELEQDLEEQYAMLEEEVQEDKKKKRYLAVFIFFLFMFLFMFGTTFSYFRVYTRQQYKNEELFLKNLYVEGYEDAFQFDSNINSYVMRVNENTQSVDLNYVVGCENCKVEVIGADDLKPGSNEVIIKITSTDTGEDTEYKVIVIVDQKPEEIPEEKPSKPVTPNKPTTPSEPNKPSEPSTPSEPEDNTPPTETPDGKDDPEEEIDLTLKNIKVTNHSLDKKFDKNELNYIVNGIYNNEDSVELEFELSDKNNEVEVKLDGKKPANNIEQKDDSNVIKFGVKNELQLGANKVETIVTDKNGNSKTYTVYLVVNKYEEDQKVIELEVDAGGTNGTYTISNIIPGWESKDLQHVMVTNKSNYDAYVDFKWINVTNSFVNTNDLTYELYKDTTMIKYDALPKSENTIIEKLKIPANTKNDYYIKYKYRYSEEDQNVDQGKSFSGTVNVSISK